MDPVSQGFLGAITAQSVAKKKTVKVALACGMAGGLAPDLDIFIRSATDPLLSLEYHRHFTHSVFFIPIGGLLVALFAKLIMFRKESFKKLYLFSTIGFATHGALDTCTAYGTRLFWPLIDYRIAWNSISIIDPAFTIPLVVFSWISSWKHSPKFARIGLSLSLLYMAFGFYQNYQATNVMFKFAQERGHKPDHYMVMPTFANLILWRSVYEHNGYFYTDAIRTSPFDIDYHHEGERVKKLNADEDFPNISEKQRNDIERFRSFTSDFMGLVKDNENIIGDYRYSSLPYSANPIWGIKIKPDRPDEHADRVSFRSAGAGRRLQEIWAMFAGVKLEKK